MLVTKSCLYGNLSELLTYGEKTSHVFLIALGVAISDSSHIDVEIIQCLWGGVLIAHFKLSFPQRIAQNQLLGKHSWVPDTIGCNRIVLIVEVYLRQIGSLALFSPHVVHVEVNAKFAHFSIVIDVGMMLRHGMCPVESYGGNLIFQSSNCIRSGFIIRMFLLQSHSIHIISANGMMLIEHPWQSQLAEELIVSHTTDAFYFLKPIGRSFRFHVRDSIAIEFAGIIIEIGE